MYRNQFNRFNTRNRLQTAAALLGAALVVLLICFAVYESTGGINPTGSYNSYGNGGDRALNAARAYGLRDAHVVGSATPWECGSADAWFSSERVQGLNINGEQVTVIVCCGPYEGFSKGCTVRF